MSIRRLLLLCIALTVFLSGFTPLLLSQTRQFLDAPVVRSQIVVRWNSSTKAMQWALDNDAVFRNMGSDTLFLAKRGIYVTYPALNPLAVQATASATAVDDPGFSAVSKLIEAITGVATAVAPTPLASGANAARLPGAGPCTDPATDIGNLVGLLYSSDTQSKALKDQAADWITTIDAGYAAGQSGPAAIGSAVTKIRNEALKITGIASRANTALGVVQTCKNAAGGAYAAALASDPSSRIDQITEIASAVTKLADQLANQYADPTKWIGASHQNFTISDEIDPTFDKMQNVTVKVAKIAANVSSASVVGLDQSSGGSASFSVRRYSSLTPEIGVGAVFGTVTQPTYGTSQNAAGQTIVAKKPDNSVSISPTILVNFVCRCGTGLLTPMVQVGAAVSKNVPAILLGGGVRLFGLSKGDVALGGGAMFAWVKDLQKLKVGDVISGTNDINSDLGFNSRPRVGGYIAIQYKF